MPVNRNALIRYRTIDQCLQNRRRKWTIENLIDACSNALYELEGIDKDISLRTIRFDLKAMRSEHLGYNAPIVVTDKKYYSYSNPDYSITNSPLTVQDLSILQDVAVLLRQFKGFSHFNEVSEMVNKLEDKIYSEQHQQPAVIDFEKNDLLTGIEWLDMLHKAILQQQTLQIHYQSFKARQSSEFSFFPYLLKEYRNRWFLLGMIKEGKSILTLALDRIAQVSVNPSIAFKYNRQFDPHTYFNDIIGVTRNVAENPITIQLLVNHRQAPYIQTKPLHASQQIIDRNKKGVVFSIRVIPNFELEKELLGFGEDVVVLSPAALVNRLKKRSAELYRRYHPADPD